jgi:large subunit ribosomal protein L10
LLGVLQAPASQLVRVLNEPASSLARVIKAYADKQNEGGESAESAPVEPAPAE